MKIVPRHLLDAINTKEFLRGEPRHVQKTFEMLKNPGASGDTRVLPLDPSGGLKAATTPPA